MPAVAKEFGSSAWLEQMFSDPPAREVKGRTRWTHRHAAWVGHLGYLAYVESRNELIGLLALEYLWRLGVVKRFKAQPFTTDESIFGREYTPDLCAQDASGVTYPVEIKTKRFITRADEYKFEQMKEKFAEFNMKFLLWTDRDPLIRPLRHNLLRLRRASTENIQPEETARLIFLLESHGPMPLWALYECDLDINLVSHAAWSGQVFVPLLSQFGEQALVDLQPVEDLASALFATEPDLHGWWNSLEVAA